ncbi:MAG: D-hexose-6-phosphate mutarotase [Alphaproteobacteria bacterium]|nr:D-hexose-6-phosphate mutarotase [Alphaproteobacteria bacterium]
MIINEDGLISLSNNKAECKISLFGGQIISYRPKSEKHDVFWLGDLNKFDNISAIRGGVPVCWPRFAAEELNNHFPRHGFARISQWNLNNILVDEDKLTAELSLIPDTRYNTDVMAELFIKITDCLECCLTTTNLGKETFKFSEALHAYFNVGNRDETVIKGLSGYRYRNSLDGKNYTLENDLQIKKEFDAAFVNHTSGISIEDKIYNRVITLEKIGSNTTIVWNPDKDLAEMSEGQYKNFICVEPANQGDAFITLQPEQSHKITMFVRVDKI